MFIYREKSWHYSAEKKVLYIAHFILFLLQSQPKHIVEERKELKKGLDTLVAAKEMIRKDPE